MELKSCLDINTAKSTKLQNKNICRTCLKVDPNSENIYNETNKQILEELRSFVEVEVCYAPYTFLYISLIFFTVQ